MVEGKISETDSSEGEEAAGERPNDLSLLNLGDMVASFTDALGIVKCDACKERQAKLNEFSQGVAKWWGIT